ncbi:Homospermidine synthase 2, partial [Orchesella cincta]
CGTNYTGRGRGRGIRNPLQTREDNGRNEQRIHEPATENSAVKGEAEQEMAPPLDEEQEEMRKLDEFLNEPNPPPFANCMKQGSRGPRGKTGSRISQQVRENENQTRDRRSENFDYATSSGNHSITVPSRLVQFIQTGSHCPPNTIDVENCKHKFVIRSGVCDPTKDFRVCIKCYGVSCGAACSRCTVDEFQVQRNKDLVDIPDGCVQQENKRQTRRQKGNRKEIDRKPNCTRRTGLFVAPVSRSFTENVQLANREEEELKKKRTISNTEPPVTSRSSESSATSIYSSAENDSVWIAKSAAPPTNRSFSSETATHPSTSRREEPVSQQPATFEDYVISLDIRQNKGQGIDLPSRLPSGIPLKVQVVSVLEPACVFVQTCDQQKRITDLQTELQNQKLKKLGISDISYGKYVAVKHESWFYRAQVEEMDPKLNSSLLFRVRLVDCGVILIEHLRNIYELPQSTFKVARQINSLTIGGIQPSKEGHLNMCESLKNRLVGQIVIVTITHALQCLTSHYYGSVTLPDESVTNYDADQVTSLIKPEYQDFEAPVFNKNEVVQIYITHVVSPSEFYVRRFNCENVEEKIKYFYGNNGMITYSATYFDGSRMCMVFDPDSNNPNPARAFCKEIDFTKEPAMATVYLIDYGKTCMTQLKYLNEYSPIMQNYQPLSYRVGISAKPVGKEWSVAATECLKEVMKYNQKGRKAELTCVGQGDGASIVEMMLDGCTVSWNQGLKEFGETLDVSDDELDEIRKPVLSTSEFINFRFAECNLSKCSKRNTTPYSFTNIPPATMPSEGETLETRRRKGVYEYLIMTQRAYDMHQELKKYCLDLVTSGKADPGDYEFKVGDVVLMKWNPTTYQRCCITGFEDRNGVEHAILTAFDIEQSVARRVGLLKRPDAFVMNMEKLSHVVWLEGTDENTLVFSKDLAEFIDPFYQRTTLKKIKILDNNKLVVRLEMLDSNGNAVSLSKQLKKYSTWDWERLYNVGFISQGRVLEKVHRSMEFTWDLTAFLKEGATMKKGTHEVELRRVNYTENPDVITIGVIPQSDDFNLLKFQMKNFYTKIYINDTKPFSNSPTYLNIVSLHESDPDKAMVLGKLKSPCEGHHRCLYHADKQSYECVDCFQMTKMEAIISPEELCRSRGLDIREICPEMLRIPPVGKHLVVKLLVPATNPRARICIKEILKPGHKIRLLISSEEPSEDGKIVAEVPDITNRLTKLMQKIKEEALDKGCLDNTTSNI